MKKIYISTLLVILLSFSGKINSQVTIASQPGYNSGWFNEIADYYDYMDDYYEYIEVGQTFKSLQTTTLTTVQFQIEWLYQAGNVDIQIYSCPSATSWGTLLGTKTNFSISGTGWKNVDISSLNIPVVAGNYYGFKLIPQYGVYTGIGANSNLYADGQSWVNNGFSQFISTIDYPFTITGAATLPVSLISFTAQKQNNDVLLQWSTANEQQSKNFIIQYGTTGDSWKDIGTAAAAGNSNTIRNYNYIHTNPASGTNYYRLLQTDIDEKTTLSETRVVKFIDDLSAFTIMANPVRNGLVQVHVNKATVLSLYNMNGSLLWKKQLGAGLQTIDVSAYAKGLYLLKDKEKSEKILLR